MMSANRRLTPDSLSRVEQLAKLRSGAHVYIAGICGKGTASVAGLLKQQGFRISGSDAAFHPPMSDVVRAAADLLYEGYSESNLKERPDIVVIGNALSADNPEVRYVMQQGIPYASMSEVICARLIGSREFCSKSIVITGTHGKTTTSSALAVLLDKAGWEPGYFIGGVAEDLPSNIRAVSTKQPLERRVVVLEGDEYDSAFFAKWAKFHSYRPDIAVITSLEFDHADIYESIEDIEAEFSDFVAAVPAAGLIVVYGDDVRLRKLATNWVESSVITAPLVFYGEDASATYRLVSRAAQGQSGQQLEFNLSGERVTTSTPLSGKHNALNLLSIAAVAHHLGIPGEQIAAGIPIFHGAKQRQQIVFDDTKQTVIEDFAHHPTAVKTTLEGLRECYPKRRIIAVFEPRSNTSRRSFFQDDYPMSFGAADVVVIKEVETAAGYSKTSAALTALDVPKIVRKLTAKGSEAFSFSSSADILSFLERSLKTGDVCVIMSNGDFDGLVGKFVQYLKSVTAEDAEDAEV